jgi:hypothetical protein
VLKHIRCKNIFIGISITTTVAEKKIRKYYFYSSIASSELPIDFT